jgi:phosphoesterase RecJ-like protein
MDQIIRHLIDSEHLLIVSHAHMDGDAVGSLLATGLAMAMVKERVTICCDTPVPAVYRFLPSSDCIVQGINDSDTFDTVLVLDCGDLARVGNLAPLISNIPVLINIDHHVTNTGYGDYQLVDSTASATAEIVYRLIKKMDIPIDKAIATSIYTGILTDTGSFRFSNTTREAFAICEEMIQLGANPYDVAQHVYKKLDFQPIRDLDNYYGDEDGVFMRRRLA